MNLTLQTLQELLGEERLSTTMYLGNLIEAGFMRMPLYLGIPQTVLNVLILSSTILILWGEETNRKPVFVLICNLSLVDLILVLVEVIVVELRKIQNTTLPRSRTCPMQICLWIFIICNIVLSTITLTLDRFIFITKPLQYKVLMSPRKGLMLCLVCWTLSALLSTISYLVYFNQYETECVLGHLVNKGYLFFLLCLGLITFGVIYVLYIVILLQFYRQRSILTSAKNNRNSVMIQDLVIQRQRRPRYMSAQVDQLCVISTVVAIGKNISAAKYVLILLLTYTIAWLPWTVTLLLEISVHLSGSPDAPSNCSDFRSLKFMEQEFQECCRSIFRQDQFSCEYTLNQMNGNRSELCSQGEYSLHTYRQDAIQMFCLIAGCGNSVFNPIIYGFWFPQYRMAVSRKLRRMFNAA